MALPDDYKRVSDLMLHSGIPREEAECAVAVERGKIPGDVAEIDAAEPYPLINRSTVDSLVMTIRNQVGQLEQRSRPNTLVLRSQMAWLQISMQPRASIARCWKGLSHS
ncbi:hypothetical protein FEF65_10000 [Mariprofundus erugo]|uniref:Uncharacterized protein n=1 Tax=Mariprofundus erugo TaxID=2528639 RepID=A0A5R9GIC9_9PROT|nr:hypothetical protein [Mariprofundus erugo]TLS66491.1 hypothetical protein FEF65_10000 [Mariprofundus erugo]